MEIGGVFTLVLVLWTVSIYGEEWTLVWEDNFNDTDITKNWKFEHGCGGFGTEGYQCYVENRKENTRVENGTLIFTAKREKWSEEGITKDFTSGRLVSKFNTTYGMFQIRARLPKGKHLWPAFWMMPVAETYGGWPASGEIDILEYRGERPHQCIGTIHYGPSWNNKGSVGTGDWNVESDLSADFHTYGFQWDKNAVRWLLDGVQIKSEAINKNLWPGFYDRSGQPFDQPFYFILNLAVGGNFFPQSVFGKFSSEDSKSWEKNTFEIDWIRVLKLQ